MITKRIVTIAGILFLTAAPAWADTTTGRITYMSSDAKQLMLDSSVLYSLGAGVDMSAVKVGEVVKLTYQNRGAEKLVTNLTAMP